VLKIEQQKVLRWRTKPFVFGILANCSGKPQTAYIPEPLCARRLDTLEHNQILL